MRSIRIKNRLPRRKSLIHLPRINIVLPFKLQHFLWLAGLAVLWWLVDMYGTPHLKFKYSTYGLGQSHHHHWCDYVGLHSRRYYPRDGECPVFKLFKEKRR